MLFKRADLKRVAIHLDIIFENNWTQTIKETGGATCMIKAAKLY